MIILGLTINLTSLNISAFCFLYITANQQCYPINMISTLRTHIRPAKLEDAQALFDYRSDKLANEYQGWVPESVEDAIEFIEKRPAEFNLPDTWFQLVIIELNSSFMVGDIGVHFNGNQNQQCELGITLRADQQGKGLAAEALKAVINYLFIELDKHRIHVSIDPANSKSILLFERLGFRKEAHLKQSFWNGKEWTDDLIYAILETEW